jgi:peptidoglycan/LPS O-acetylase OafA/YrhL
MKNPINERISAIDGWRAISVTLVIFCHLLWWSSIRSDSDFAIAIAAGSGTLGVRVFFVISGFVICRGFIQEQAQNGRISLAAFYVRRIFRILPPLIVFLSVVSSLALIGLVYHHALAAIKGLLFICDIEGVDCGGYLGNHQWSLAVEEQFYLVFPLAFIFSVSVPRASFFLAISFAIASIAIALWVAKFSGAATTIGNFVFIGAGVTSAFYEHRIAKLAPNVPPAVVVLAVLAVMTISILDAHLQIKNQQFAVGYWPAELVTTILVSFLMPFLIAFILLATTFGQSFWKRFLAAPLMTTLGRISYSVYLWQQLATYPFAGAGYLFYVLSVSLCVLFCLGSYYYFEKPLIVFGRELSGRLQMVNS